jgi:hypothetical protein
MDFLKRTLIFLALLAGLGSTGTAFAAFGCYDPGLYPSVYGLSATPGGLQALLGQTPGESHEPGMRIQRYAVLSSDGTWGLRLQLCTIGPCDNGPFSGQGCARGISVPDLPGAELKKIAPEMLNQMDDESGEDSDSGNNAANGTPPDLKPQAGSCVESTGAIWFGLSFYCGEGTCGVGGIGRYDEQTGKVEMRYPSPFVDFSIEPIAYDGHYLWFGTIVHSECTGDDPGVGLVRYDWKTGVSVSFGGGTDSRRDPDGPCGFEFNDIYVDKRGLWVSSDMGLAFLANPQDEVTARFHWVNYVPDSKNPKQAMVKASCKTLYGQLLKTLPHNDMNGADEYKSHYDQLFQTLKGFNPDLLAKLALQ